MSLRALETSVDPESPPSPLHTAAERGHFAFLETIICGSPDIVNTDDFYGRTALLLAADVGHYDIVKYLLEKGAHVDQADRKRRTPLFVAVKANRGECVRLLLAAGATPDGDPGNMTSPISMTAMYGYEESLKLLIEYGARLTCSPLFRFSTPHLWTCVVYDQYNCYKLLLLACLRRGLYQNSHGSSRLEITNVSVHVLARNPPDWRYTLLLYETGMLAIIMEAGGVLNNVQDGSRERLKSLIESPRKLLSQCRQAVMAACLNTDALPLELQRYVCFDCLLDQWTRDDKPIVYSSWRSE